MSSDAFDLQRFLDAQEPVIDTARAELARGRKQTHWMWFVFPQIRGLGFSAMAQHYAIRSLDEAKAYEAHSVLGPRLKECTSLVLAARGRTIHDIFGSPDDLKFRSSITLFARAAPDAPEFRAALDRYFGGEDDKATLANLGSKGLFRPGTEPARLCSDKLS
jgi:uncharacterized protein (DUF1810 family)